MSTARDKGWELGRRAHFDEIVAQYDRIRPTYPGPLFADVLSYLGKDVAPRALEIGAGTGKATAVFLDAGCDVTAVEIGENMAAFLRERFHGQDGFRVVSTSFEEAALENASFDLIYAASAFHWVDAEIGCPKAFQLLRNGGVLALFRYHAVPTIGDALYEEMQAVYAQYYHPYIQPVRKTGEEFWQPAEM